jgi:AcrR family transcriptional regulator
MPNTFTQRGIPVVGSSSGPTPVSRFGDGSAMRVCLSIGRSVKILAVTGLPDTVYRTGRDVTAPSSRILVLVPRLWTQTIEAHRREVREAILASTAALVAERGLLSVTMSQIAEQTGIGRATLYKYFPDVEAILVAWHDRHVAGHLEQLSALRDRAGDPMSRLAAVLGAYARICHYRGQHASEIDALVHRAEHVARAQQQLLSLFRDVLAEAARAGQIRGDATPDELASYCLHALAAAGSLPSEAAVRRLVAITLGGLAVPG